MPCYVPYRHHHPVVHPTAFIADTVALVGDVQIAAEASLWWHVVVRGDVCPVRIGARTNIQDGTVVHVTRETGPTHIGADVTVGHKALLHACTLEDACFVGMGAVVLDGVHVETGAMVAAGAVVTPGKRVPAGEIWAGNPAKYLRALRPEEAADILASAARYCALAQHYKP